jgi:hypothetical protein
VDTRKLQSDRNAILRQFKAERGERYEKAVAYYEESWQSIKNMFGAVPQSMFEQAENLVDLYYLHGAEIESYKRKVTEEIDISAMSKQEAEQKLQEIEKLDEDFNEIKKQAMLIALALCGVSIYCIYDDSEDPTEEEQLALLAARDNCLAFQAIVDSRMQIKDKLAEEDRIHVHDESALKEAVFDHQQKVQSLLTIVGEKSNDELEFCFVTSGYFFGKDVDIETAKEDRFADGFVIVYSKADVDGENNLTQISSEARKNLEQTSLMSVACYPGCFMWMKMFGDKDSIKIELESIGIFESSIPFETLVINPYSEEQNNKIAPCCGAQEPTS